MSTCYQIPNVTRSKVSHSNTRHRFCINSVLIPLFYNEESISEYVTWFLRKNSIRLEGV